MAFVLEYTIIAGGHTYKSEGTSPQKALMAFISKPPVRSGYREGNYSVTDGERITVVGPDPQEFTARWNYAASLRMNKEEVAKLEGRRTDRAKHVRARLEVLEADPVPEPQNRIVTFTMRARLVFDAVTEETLVHEARIPKLRKEIEGIGGPLRLLVNRERVTPSGDILTGEVQSFDDEGVWINNHLVPWVDIEGAVAVEVETVS